MVFIRRFAADPPDELAEHVRIVFEPWLAALSPAAGATIKADPKPTTGDQHEASGRADPRLDLPPT